MKYNSLVLWVRCVKTISQEISQRVRHAHTLANPLLLIQVFFPSSSTEPVFIFHLSVHPRTVACLLTPPNHYTTGYSSKRQQFLRFSYFQTWGVDVRIPLEINRVSPFNDTVPVPGTSPNRADSHNSTPHSSYSHWLLGPPARIYL